MNTTPIEMQETSSKSKAAGLWRMMVGFRKVYLSAILLVGLAALASTGMFYLLAYLVDDVLGSSEQLALIPWLALAFIGLAMLQGGFTYLSGRLAAFTAEGITLRLRNYIYNHLQRLTFSYHDNMQTGELLSRATSDVDALRRVYAEQLIGIGRLVLLFSVYFTALVQLNARLAIYSVVVIPFIILISFYFFVKMGKAYEAYQDQDARLSSRLQEYLTGVRVVKAFARQAYEQNKFEQENSDKFKRGRTLIAMHAAFWPVTDIVLGTQMLVGFYIGARMAIDGVITTGMYIAYAGLVIQIIWPIRNLGRLIAQMSTGFVSYGRLMEIIGQVREPLDTGTVMLDGDVIGEITFKDVNFAYVKDDPVLHDINFEVRSGQTVALLGATGSGKSSLVNLLPRFYDYQGSILLDGVELTSYPRGYLRTQIGTVQQEPFLFSRTIRENIAFGLSREVTDEEVIAAAKAAAIHDVICTFPDGYDTLVGERGVTLSGGQKQRVTLARTLLKSPRILILDDATSSVDTETESQIRAALKGLMQNCTTFIIAHRIQSVMNADLILVLENGRIVQRGTHRQLINQPGTYRETYELQARIEDELEAELAAVTGTKDNYQNGRAPAVELDPVPMGD